jgi:hypothetical protein
MMGIWRNGWPERAPRTRIEWDDHRLWRWRESGGCRSEALEWSDVRRVTAFKLDLIGSDEVCLRFDSALGVAREFSESEPGWSELLLALPHRLPGVPHPDQWHEDVAWPAFATNETVLFERPRQAADPRLSA